MLDLNCPYFKVFIYHFIDNIYISVYESTLKFAQLHHKSQECETTLHDDYHPISWWMLESIQKLNILRDEVQQRQWSILLNWQQKSGIQCGSADSNSCSANTWSEYQKYGQSCTNSTKLGLPCIGTETKSRDETSEWQKRTTQEASKIKKIKEACQNQNPKIKEKISIVR